MRDYFLSFNSYFPVLGLFPFGQKVLGFCISFSLLCLSCLLDIIFSTSLAILFYLNEVQFHLLDLTLLHLSKDSTEFYMGPLECPQRSA